ncbi:MAG: hypothetical protein HW404_825 [Anaerolineales bacterium]|nr:hypothetical protein [Anaerolineales bacterium]MBM2842988.1 hypothetical protein [Anaerolineales bacterium]
MRGRTGAPATVDLSIRIYTWLLAAYPGQFRTEYGHHMAQVFRDVCRRDYRRGGLSGITSLWARTSLDLIRTTVEEHIERGLEMNREKFVRWSGWALVAGAVLFAAGMIIGSFDSYDMDPIGGVDAFYEISQAVGLALGQVLFVIGLLGLRAGYAGRSGSLGAGLLLLAVIGSVASLAGLLAMSSFEDGWLVWMGGYLTMTLALTIFGIVAVRRRVFSRWNYAPILAGIGVPLLFGIGMVGVSSVSGQAPEWGAFLAVVLTSVGLILIGYRMQAEAGRTGEVEA